MRIATNYKVASSLGVTLAKDAFDYANDVRDNDPKDSAWRAESSRRWHNILSRITLLERTLIALDANDQPEVMEAHEIG